MIIIHCFVVYEKNRNVTDRDLCTIEWLQYNYLPDTFYYIESTLTKYKSVPGTMPLFLLGSVLAIKISGNTPIIHL